MWISATFEGVPVVSLLAARDVGSVLRFLARRGWSRAALGAATGLSENRVRAVAKGEQMITSYDVLTRIADGLAIDRGLMGLALVAPSRALPASTGRGALDREPDPAMPAVPQIRKLGTRGISVDPGLGGWEADDALLDRIRAVAEGYLLDDPVAIYTRASALADRAFARLFAADQPSPDGYDSAGYLYAMLAWIAGDLGRRQASDAHARSAWLCASLSGNDTVRAWVLSTMSKTALWEGRPRAAAQLAARGRSLASAGTARVMLACQEADAWAAYGASDSARESLSAAEALTERASADDVGGLLACGPLRYLNYASAVLVKIGDPGRAARAADEALRLAHSPGPPPAYGTLAQTRISAALAQIEIGELDGAVELLTPVLTTPPNQRLGPVAARMLGVERAISGRRELRSTAAATQLVESIGDFCAHTAGHELPY